MTTDRRVMVIGLDGATTKVISPLADMGIMPAMKSLIDKGAYGPLMSVNPPVTAPAWTSFLTGQQPGKHGLFDFVRREPGTIFRVPVNYTDIKSPTLLSIVGRQPGKRMCSYNVPLTFPPLDINGIVVSGLMTPNTEVAYTSPPEIKEEIEADGRYILDVFWQRYSDATAEQFMHQLIHYERQKIHYAKTLQGKDKWDLFVTVFTGTDRVQHSMWHVIDAIIHDRKLSRRWERCKPLVKEYFQVIDSGIGDLIQAAGPETTTIFVSDHGFGALLKKFHINTWLQQEGYLDFDVKRAGKLARRNAFRQTLKRQLSRIGVINRLQTKGIRFAAQGRKKKVHMLSQINWNNSKAYSVSNTEQGIYINLEDREPDGTVSPESYESLRDELIEKLRAVRDPADGKPIVSHIFKREELYHGEHSDAAPDIVFFLRDGDYLADVNLSSRLYGPASWLTGRGTHRLDGLFLAAGGPITKCHDVELTLPDIAPIILYILGMPIPEDMDGRVPMHIFDQSFTASEQPDYQSGGAREEETSDFALSEEEKKMIFDKLKGLGYM